MKADSLKNKVELNLIKSFDKLEKIKSKFILKMIFNNLLKKKFFVIIKFINNIKKRIDININDYKAFSELIEIEIKTANKKYGKFINIKKEDKKYYHIFFNNNEEEIKRNYINEGEEIKKIKISIEYKINSLKDLFYCCKCIESIYFKKFNRNNINNISFMFSGCSSLKE